MPASQSSFWAPPIAAVCMICASLRPPPTHSRSGVGCCRIWASWRSPSPRWTSWGQQRNPAARSSPWRSNWRTKPCTIADDGSSTSTAVSNAVALWKTASACGSRASVIWWWNAAVPCIISGCVWPRGSRWFNRNKLSSGSLGALSSSVTATSSAIAFPGPATSAVRTRADGLEGLSHYRQSAEVATDGKDVVARFAEKGGTFQQAMQVVDLSLVVTDGRDRCSSQRPGFFAVWRGADLMGRWQKIHWRRLWRIHWSFVALYWYYIINQSMLEYPCVILSNQWWHKLQVE